MVNTRNYLEFSDDEWIELRNLCKQLNVDFMCTPFDEPSLQHLISLDVDLLSIFFRSSKYTFVV